MFERIINVKWLYKLEYKYSKFAINNLMLVIVIGQAMVYFADLFAPAAQVSYRLSLSFSAVMQGEIWRILTFIFVPPYFSSLFFLAISLYFYYFIGSTLERTWGAFKFNMYYLLGILGTILGSVVVWLIAPNYYGLVTLNQLNLSLFFAFAMLYPDMQLMLFFIIPVKIKYLAFFSASVMVFQLFTSSWGIKIATIMALINFFIFFGNTFITKTKNYFKYKQQRRNWRK